jgi:hypothetical protein
MATPNSAVQHAVTAAAAATRAAKALDPAQRTVLTVKDQAEIIAKLAAILSVAHSALRFTGRISDPTSPIAEARLASTVADAANRAANTAYRVSAQLDGVRGRVRADVTAVKQRYPRSAEHTGDGQHVLRLLSDTFDAVYGLDRAVYAGNLSGATVADFTELARRFALLTYGLTNVCRNDSARVNATYTEVQWARRAGVVQNSLVDAARLLAIVSRIMTNLYGRLVNANGHVPVHLSA